MTISQWLISWLRDCPIFPTFLFYNSQGENSDNLAVIENMGDNKVKTYIDGSFVATHPFMLLMKTHQEEASELELQKMFSEVQKWIKEQNEKEYQIDDKTIILSVESTSNLVLMERDEDLNATYQAMFNIKYFKGV